MPETARAKEPEAVVVRREPEKDLVVWLALARPFKKRDRKFYVTVISLVGVMSLIFFLAEGVMPVILLISLFFLFYVMNTIPPETVEYKITTRGISVAGKKIDWSMLGRFCFVQKEDLETLVVETATFPGRMELIIASSKKEEIRKALSSYLPEEEIPPSSLDKVAGWISKKLPQ